MLLKPRNELWTHYEAASVVYHKKRQWDVVDVVSLTKDFSFCYIVNPLFGEEAT